MAKQTIEQLKDGIRHSNPGRGAGQRRGYKSSLEHIVDSTHTIDAITGLTVSESGVVTIEFLQPEKSLIEEVTVVCTAEASLDGAALLGFRLGTTLGGEDIITGDDANTGSIHASSATFGAGTGSSTNSSLTTALDGNANIEPITVNTPFSSAGRSLYAQVSASANKFDDNVGEFAVSIKYIKL